MAGLVYKKIVKIVDLCAHLWACGLWFRWFLVLYFFLRNQQKPNLIMIGYLDSV